MGPQVLAMTCEGREFEPRREQEAFSIFSFFSVVCSKFQFFAFIGNTM